VSTEVIERSVLGRIFEELNLTKLEDWYQVSVRKVTSLGGRPVLSRHGDSLAVALQAAYPEHKWEMWKFKKMPHKWIAEVRNQRIFMDHLAKDVFKFESLDGWYPISTNDLQKNGGSSVLWYYNGSIYHALRAIYPDHVWRAWKFKTGPKGYWKSIDHRKEFFQWASEELRILKPQDWYKVTLRQFGKIRGSVMLREHYGHSLATALQDMYPNHFWPRWKFERTPNGFWDNPETRRKFFLMMAEDEGWTSMDQWYDVTSKKIRDHGGAGLMELHYANSVSRALMDLFPNHEWESWRFAQTPKTTHNN
jgi:hypothetical protein